MRTLVEKPDKDVSVAGSDQKDVTKPVKEYKGEVKKLPFFEGQTGIPVQRMVANPVYKSQWTKVNLPKFFQVVAVTKYPYGDLTHTVSYFDSKSNRVQAVSLPKNLELKHLTGLQGKALTKRYEDFLVDNLPTNLAKSVNTIGSDPEMFVEDNKGKIIPAFEFLPSKEDSKIFTTNYGEGSVYWDGFQAEFTSVANPCLGYNMDSLRAGLKTILEQAKKFNTNARLSTKTLVEIPIKTLQKTNPKYVEFGCKPSMNVYGLKSDLTMAANEVTYRSTGGHLHLGMAKPTEEAVVNVVKAMDAIIGVACVSMFENFDHPMRRRFYGLAGEYRLPAHGIEYRTLSNAWLFHPVISNMVIDVARKAASFGLMKLMKMWKTPEEETVETIMTCNVKKAREILDLNQEIFKKIILSCYPANYGGSSKTIVNSVWKAFYQGMEAVVKDPSDFEENWRLEKTWTAHCDGVHKNVHNSADWICDNKKV